MAEHTGESLPSSVEDSSLSTGSVIDALVYAELAQVQAFSIATGIDALNAHAGAEATRDLIRQIRTSCQDLSLPFDKKLYRVSHLVPQWVPTPIARLLGTEISAKDAMMSLAAARTSNPTSAMPFLPDLRPDSFSISDRIADAGISIARSTFAGMSGAVARAIAPSAPHSQPLQLQQPSIRTTTSIDDIQSSHDNLPGSSSMTFHSLPPAPLMTGAVLDGANGLQQLNEHGAWIDDTLDHHSSRKPRSKASSKLSSQKAAKRAEIARLRLALAEAELDALEEGEEDGSQDLEGTVYAEHPHRDDAVTARSPDLPIRETSSFSIVPTAVAATSAAILTPHVNPTFGPSDRQVELSGSGILPKGQGFNSALAAPKAKLLFAGPIATTPFIVPKMKSAMIAPPPGLVLRGNVSAAASSPLTSTPQQLQPRIATFAVEPQIGSAVSAGQNAGQLNQIAPPISYLQFAADVFTQSADAVSAPQNAGQLNQFAALFGEQQQQQRQPQRHSTTNLIDFDFEYLSATSHVPNPGIDAANFGYQQLALTQETLAAHTTAQQHLLEQQAVGQQPAQQQQQQQQPAAEEAEVKKKVKIDGAAKNGGDPSDSSSSSGAKKKKKKKAKREALTSDTDDDDVQRKADSTFKPMQFPTHGQLRMFKQHMRKAFKRFSRSGVAGYNHVFRCEDPGTTFDELGADKIPGKLRDADDGLAESLLTIVSGDLAR